MKEYYEQIPKTKLMRRCPVIIRIDGRAFHSFCKRFQKPFDPVMMEAMQRTTKYLCEHIQGCVFGYSQSDEISLLLIDYKKLNSSAWFDNEVQKMCSISASMATMAFNRILNEISMDIDPSINIYVDPTGEYAEEVEEQIAIAKNYGYDGDFDNWCRQCGAYNRAINKGAMFDSRVFSIPREEVTNYFYWRQLDAIRNSIEMVGQANYSPKELHKKNCTMICDMLLEKDIIWSELPIDCQRGSCCYKETYKLKDTTRNKWIIDHNIPLFKNEDRFYIDRWIGPEEL